MARINFRIIHFCTTRKLKITFLIPTAIFSCIPSSNHCSLTALLSGAHKNHISFQQPSWDCGSDTNSFQKQVRVPWKSTLHIALHSKFATYFHTCNKHWSNYDKVKLPFPSPLLSIVTSTSWTAQPVFVLMLGLNLNITAYMAVIPKLDKDDCYCWYQWNTMWSWSTNGSY